MFTSVCPSTIPLVDSGLPFQPVHRQVYLPSVGRRRHVECGPSLDLAWTLATMTRPALHTGNGNKLQPNASPTLPIVRQ